MMMTREELFYELYASSKRHDSWQRQAMIRELRNLLNQPKESGSDHFERSGEDRRFGGDDRRFGVGQFGEGADDDEEQYLVMDEELAETEVATELNGIEDRAVENEANSKVISVIVKEESIPQILMVTEADSTCVQQQVSISPLEHSLNFYKANLDDDACQVFDVIPMRTKVLPKEHKERLKPKTKRKLSLSLKTWMFKFKSTSKRRKSLDVKSFSVEEIAWLMRDSKEIYRSCVDKEFKAVVAGCGKKLFDRFQIVDGTSKLAVYEAMDPNIIKYISSSSRANFKHLLAVFDLQNNPKRFADGEIYVQLQESVRGCDVFLVQPTCPPANENLMELLVMIDVCRRASAKPITAVIPYFGYARADRQTHGCASIAAKLNLITQSGADRVLACDLRSGQSMGYFDIPVDYVYGQPEILDYLASKGIYSDDLVVVSPEQNYFPQLTVLSVANILGEPIWHVHDDYSLVLERTAYHEWHRWKHKTAYLQGLLEFVGFTLVNFYSNVTAETSISQPMGLAQHGDEEIMWMLLFWSTTFKKQRFGKNWWFKYKCHCYSFCQESFAYQITSFSTNLEVKVSLEGEDLIQEMSV